MSCINLLKEHGGLNLRHIDSISAIDDLKANFSSAFTGRLADLELNVFAAGSLGRLEAGRGSDLDVFVTSSKCPSRVDEYQIFAKIIQINQDLGYPELSNDGEYLKVFAVDDVAVKKIGSPQDDHENWFTARMLLLLESKSLSGDKEWEAHVRKVLGPYFRDAKDRLDFRPIFLLNDILRYWRTVCLNYEVTRHDQQRSWKKKNITLKYSRRLTVFATALYLAAFELSSVDDVVLMVRSSALERLACALDKLNFDEDRFAAFLNDYFFFCNVRLLHLWMKILLSWKRALKNLLICFVLLSTLMVLVIPCSVFSWCD